RLKRAGFDLSIDLQNSRLTHLLAWLSGIPVRIGYRRRWGWLVNRAVPLPRGPMPPVGHQHYLLQHAGVSPDGDALELWPSEQDEQRAAQLLQHASVGAAHPLVGLHIGGSRRWKTKRWDVSRWAALCDRLAARGAHVVVTGSAADRRLAEQLLRLTRAHPIMAVGNTRLMELACVIRRCQVFVTIDSAPLHVAAAMGTPTIALFGPTDPARHAPVSPAVRVIKKTLPCSPCYSTWCRTITHACMNRIQADEVASVVGELLQASG
ncbi:MAG: glycosyltransferase family 9 protein, partial [Candidatus Omnitrophica bacterium]|nr:glycosyltransferase family 9 protein [Candidatus Omnitrophota bacterium]